MLIAERNGPCGVLILQISVFPRWYFQTDRDILFEIFIFLINVR